jgi:hypothetical protein
VIMMKSYLFLIYICSRDYTTWHKLEICASVVTDRSLFKSRQVNWIPNYVRAIIVAERSKSRNILSSSTDIVGSNPTRYINFCVYFVFLLSFVGRRADTLYKGVLPTAYKINKWQPNFNLITGKDSISEINPKPSDLQ